MKNKVPLPQWCKEAQKAMIDKDLDCKELGELCGCARQTAAAVVNGRFKSDRMITKICKILEIEAPEDNTLFHK